MSSSSSEDEDWEFYRDREEWKDVTPLPQDDGPHPAVAIAYTDRFKDVYDYFRSVMKSNEQSERALRLVTDAITLNAANYTVWNFRRVLLKSLGKDLNAELDYITNIIVKQPKNYQVWYHRGIVVKWLDDSSQEFEFTARMLKKDSKNYHCWQHRQLVLNHFNLWQDEVDFTTEKLNEDCRNNSAWNQRYYSHVNTKGFTQQVLQTEISFTKAWIKKVPNNESAWNYLNGVLTAGGGLHNFASLCAEFESMLEGGCDSPYLLALLVEYYDDTLEHLAQDKQQYQQNGQRAVTLCTMLAEDVDTIRKEYWNYIKRDLESKLAKT